MYRVQGSPEFDRFFDELQKKAGQGDSESLQLIKLIERGIEKLKWDYRYGEHIAKNKIPEEYRKKFGITNLWKINLGSFWRLLYTIRGTEIEIVSILLEALDHKKYDRKFGYKTS